MPDPTPDPDEPITLSPLTGEEVLRKLLGAEEDEGIDVGDEPSEEGGEGD
ncbi:MAG: hypothetical protein ACREGR_00280 [Minisyncoccia bacterium]